MVGAIVSIVLWCIAGWIFNRTVRSLHRQNAALLLRVMRAQDEASSAANEAATAKDLAKLAAGDAASALRVANETENRLTSNEKTPKVVTTPKRGKWSAVSQKLNAASDKEYRESE